MMMGMGLPDDIPVTLVIKAPNQRMADQTVECQPTWTIKKLKQHLESVYPSKPKHNEQRLIYLGRLLQDHLVLKEILRQYEGSDAPNRHTVHLVCSCQQDPPSPQQNQVEKNPSPVQTPSQTSDFPQSTDGLRHRLTQQGSQPEVSTPPSPGGWDMYSAYQPGGEYSPEQYAAMMQQQQLYSQYMMQYMHYYQSAAMYPYQSFNPQAFFPQPFGPMNPPTSTAAAGGSQPAADPNNAAPRAGPARQNVRMNAQGGMEEDDEDDGEPRDWLHHTYFFMRFLTFMGILFFYSNVTRFLVVFSGSIAIYILQKLRKFLQRREQEQQRQAARQEAANNNPANDQQAPPPEQQQQPQPQAPHPPAAPAAENGLYNVQQPAAHLPGQPEAVPAEAAAGDNGTPAADQAAQAEPPEEGRLARMFLFACNTVQTFFTSLVPAPPELLEGN